MVVVLVLIMVAAIILFQMWREGSLHLTDRDESLQEVPLVYSNVEGVEIPESYYFHPFHLWIKKESNSTAKVGIDDYSRRLIGKVNEVLLPRENTKVASGQSCIRFDKDDVLIPIASPLTGEVIRSNDELLTDPSILTSDPYEKGWLFEIKSWNLLEQLKSLMTSETARSWMKGSVIRLKIGTDNLAGAVAQDGGELVEDFREQLHEFEWIQALRENMGTEPIRKI